MAPLLKSGPLIINRFPFHQVRHNAFSMPLSTESHNVLPTNPRQGLQASTNDELGTVTQDLETAEPFSRLKSAFLIFAISSMAFSGCALSGILTISLPNIAKDLHLQEDLLLWYALLFSPTISKLIDHRPASIYALTCGCTLLLSGSLADQYGCRRVYLAGGGLLACFTLGCSVAENGLQLIIFRAFSGIAMSLCLTSATSMITSAFSTGPQRNIAFSCYGSAQPFGFSLGLVLAGVAIETRGWRFCYYLVTGVVFVSFFVASWFLPPERSRSPPSPRTFQDLKSSIDWLGAGFASTSIALFSYLLAVATTSISKINTPANISMLAIAILLIPTFLIWIHYRERCGKTVILPPLLFRSTPMYPHRARIFASTCLAVFLTFGAFMVFSYFASLYYQRIQKLTALATSPRFLPMVLTGAAVNIVTGILVYRINAISLVFGAAAITTVAPLLMALSKPTWSYWSATFAAMTLAPIAADTIFTIANLIITNAFPSDLHGLAGGVFNTIAQLGNAVALALSAVVANEVTRRSKEASGGEEEASALLTGYRASFYFSMAASAAAMCVVAWGLRGSGKVGLKTE